MLRSAIPLVVLCRLALSPVVAQAPEGFTTQEDESAGYRFYCPKSYTAIPLQPGEPIVCARYVRRASERATKDARGKVTRAVEAAEMWILSIPKPPQRPTPSGEPAEAPPPAEPPTAATAKTEWEIVEAKLSASSFEEFVKKRLPSWTIKSTETEEKQGRQRTKYTLECQVAGRMVQRGSAWIVDCADRYLGLFACALDDEFDHHLPTFSRSGLSLKEIEAQQVDTQALVRHYERHPEYADPEFRVARRAELVRGWAAIDTPNYLILHHTKDKTLLRKVEQDLEGLRTHLSQIYPPVAGKGRVAVVRVCKDRGEYLFYGGAGMSAGYFNPLTQELVLYDNVAGKEGSRFGNRDSCLVLYHEAFHQYIFYAAGGVAPHYWFNEGNADYFGGAQLYSNTHRVREIAVNPWRLEAIKKTLQLGKAAKLEEFIHFDRAKYYAPAQAASNYAQGWSLVYFLRESKAATRHPLWPSILANYFETLKTAFAEEGAALGDSPTLEKKQQAEERAREKAIQTAFEGVDLVELEAAWKDSVAKLR
ncbi:MAG: DUF1570 domain-containing protein [Planctomycetota bacterium]